MNCPLMKVAAIMSTNRTNSIDVSCDEGDCEWWHEGDTHCSISDISSNLYLILLALTQLVNKILSVK